MVTRFYWYLDTLIKKNPSKLDPLKKKRSESAHDEDELLMLKHKTNESRKFSF